MRELPQVTLVCVDTRTPELALAAMQRCQAGLRFAEALLFTDPARLAEAPPGIRVLPLAVDSVPAYSQFMLRGLLPYVATSHLLVVQWDGYVLDASRWDDEFLRFDYIGAPLRNEPPERAVGNGGFSLRSRRLLQALADPLMNVSHPEDTCICHDNRARLEQAHGIRFAPVELAARFAYERLPPPGPTFGFHGLFNFHRVMDPGTLLAFVECLPDGFARGLDAHDLARSLVAEGQLEAAQAIVSKRRRLGMRDRRTLRLRWQLWRAQGRARSA